MNITFYVDLNGARLKPYYLSAVKEYEKRLGAYCKTKLVFAGRDAKIPAPHSGKNIKVVIIIAGEHSGNYFLDGAVSSEDLAATLQDWMTGGCNDIWLMLGTGAGHGGGAEHSKNVLAVSRMHMSTELLTVIAYEQLYRAWRIIRGEPYHK